MPLPPAVAVATRTMVGVTINPAPRGDPLWRQRSPKAIPLPVLVQRPRLPLLSPPHTPHPIKPSGRIKQNDAEDDDVSGDESVSTVSDVLRLMDALGLPIEVGLYASLLKECTERRDAAHGAQVHAHLRRSAGSLLRGPGGTLLGNRLLLMYAACGRVSQAAEVLDGMPTRDSTSWATMIAGLWDAGEHRQALWVFAEMLCEQGLVHRGPADVLSIATVLRCCTGVRDIAFGECVHGLVLKLWGGCTCTAGDASRLGSALIRFYGILGQEDGAREVFSSMKNLGGGSAAVWNAMAVAYCRLGMVGEALELVREMRKAGRRLSSSLVSSVIRACGRRGEETPGRQVHACAVKLGVDGDSIVQCSLVEMYGRCGLVSEARMMIIGRGRHRTVTEDGAAFRDAILGILTESGSSMDAIRGLYKIGGGTGP